MGRAAVLTVRDRSGREPPSSRTGPHLAPPPPVKPARTRRSYADVGATAALALLTIASAAGFERVFAGHSWLGPVLLAAIMVHVECWAARRVRLPLLVYVILGLATVWLVAAWTILAPYTHFGIPDSQTSSQFVNDIRQAHQDFATTVAPADPTEGYRLLAVIGTGLAAFLGDWFAFRWKSALLGVAPAFALFVVCCTVGQGSGRQWAIFVEVFALLLFMLAHRAAFEGAERIWFAGSQQGVVGWFARSGALIGCLALLTALLVTPLLGSVEGVGIFGWRSGVGPGSAGPRIVANPVVDLRTRLIQLSQTQVFTVQSPVPSYWRLTSLDNFNGQTWTSTGSYRSFGFKLPGTGSIPPGTRQVQETFQIENLNSVWLPDAFTPVSVAGVKGVSYDANTGSLITSRQTSNGLTYSVISYQYLSTLNAADLEAAPRLTNLSSLKADLQLPSSVSSEVIDLAKSITAGKPNEYTKALALQDYFQSPRFTYSLDPPADGSGSQALSEFLFVTHSGYCQQFAGAYAVLARAAGLPTRLAVGFSTGNAFGNNEYQVLDADAHTWPEVYFGPKFGWLPFEPTPSFDNPGASNYAPNLDTGAGTTTPGGEALPIAPKGVGVGTGTKGQSQRTSPTTTVASASGGSSGQHSGAWSPIIWIIPAILGWIAVNAVVRRLRWRYRRGPSRSDQRDRQVLGRWADVSELLAWWGVTRQPSETDDEFARRAAHRISQQLGEPSPWLVGGVLRMAGLAREAAFAAEIPAGRPREAALVATEIHQRLFRSAKARQLLTWAFVPRPRRRVNDPANSPAAG
jgi:transglutaminase-like putative cysteine protease